MPSSDKPPKAKELLKLMPLDKFGKLIEVVSHVPKDAIEDKKRPDGAKRRRGVKTS